MFDTNDLNDNKKIVDRNTLFIILYFPGNMKNKYYSGIRRAYVNNF